VEDDKEPPKESFDSSCCAPFSSVPPEGELIDCFCFTNMGLNLLFFPLVLSRESCARLATELELGANCAGFRNKFPIISEGGREDCLSRDSALSVWTALCRTQSGNWISSLEENIPERLEVELVTSAGAEAFSLFNTSSVDCRSRCVRKIPTGMRPNKSLKLFDFGCAAIDPLWISLVVSNVRLLQQIKYIFKIKFYVLKCVQF
jgi:hypothetical protein